MTLNHHALPQLAGGVLQQGFDRRHRRVGLLNEFISSGGTGCGRGHEGSLVRLKRHQLYECTAPKKSERPGGSSCFGELFNAINDFISGLLQN
jgi:hypothetical protein